MCTPTGAALLATFVGEWTPLPPMRVHRVGVGAGGRDPEELPNVVRLVLGEPAAEPSPPGPVVLETNVDDLDPRLWPGVLDGLFAAGASDAWLTPILMKKGRPAHTLSVLVRADAASAVRAAIFRHTSTIGLREQTIGKHALDREMASVEIDGQQIAVKLARHDGVLVNVQPEYDDVVWAAAALGRPVNDVLADAIAASRAFYR